MKNASSANAAFSNSEFAKKAALLIAVALASLAFLPGLASAADPQRLIVNSADWRDVYSVMLYGSLIDKNANFLVSERHGGIILNQIPNTEHLWIFTSSRTPFVYGYGNFVTSRGYSNEEFTSSNTNLDLAERLENIRDFVVVDDSYGYNAISVAPYAASTDTYVLFADEQNINDVVDFLEERNPDSIILYGQVDREVRDALAAFNPEVINKGGDRFANNIEIVKKYQSKTPAKQAILTNGEFIEREIMSGVEPVIFIGTNNVPQIVSSYIQGSDIQVGILIGNELVSTATSIRRQIGISVFVKFAQGARVPQGAISQVEALDMFYLPVYLINLQFENMVYNRATNKLEVSLRNTNDLGVYMMGTFTLIAEDGTRITVGDTEPVFIDGNELKTLIYDVEGLPDGQLSGSVYVIYGESANSLEKIIQLDLENVEAVRIIDNCKVQINEVTFNTRSKTFNIEVENAGSSKCYVDAEIPGVIVAGDSYIMGHDGVEDLSPGQKKSLRIKTEPPMLEEDLPDNEEVRVRVFYGERESSLVNVLEQEMQLLISKADYLFYTLIVVIILLLLLIVWKKRKKKKHAAQE